ncbi:putative F420-dependent oxidoreductase [Crossiella equi]|uniref:F420-dependent oxidoreductase n=1 Tax=Crossiella equi TaxID=130796 RepID=A0ABS5ABA1_9PSEU|nr:TIGR03620 family F420-dependent LLM class oxidoreductase [Crossiella equi]MBP2473869.1 putative F420-dependent oxidoreductase [Crossiella equi]
MAVELGKVGVWTWAFDRNPWAAVRAGVREIEDLGYGTVWFGEATGRDATTQAALLLGATERIVVAPGVANIYRHHPATLAQAERALAEAYPDRFVLGLGVGARFLAEAQGQAWRPPLTAMREFLTAMDTAPLSAPPGSSPRVLAALGPRMLALAGERTWGAHPFFMPVEHTAFAREHAGPDAVLAVHQNIVVHEDPERARVRARASIAPWLASGDRTGSRWPLMKELTGFTDADLADGGSDRLVDAVVAAGSAEQVAARVQAQLDAGADHVCVSVNAMSDSPDLGLRELRALAEVLR